MLSEKEKKEMLADALDLNRRQKFLLAEKRKPKDSRKLDDYIAFPMDVQKIKPFEHRPAITPTAKNIL
jgi:hypothetical protein